MPYRSGRVRSFALFLIPIVACAALVAVALQSTRAEAQQSDTSPYYGDVPTHGGIALLTTTRVTSATEIRDTLTEAGCDVTYIGITVDGLWVSYAVDAPPFVNASFPASLEPGIAFAERCDEPVATTEPTAQDAADVLQTYFADLDAGQYQAAYDLWREGANGQTLEEFAAGYEHTATISADIGTPGRIDAGAGQRYIEIPVTITSTLDDGTVQHFEGTFVLHHTADIPGATQNQREWHINSAEIEQSN